MPKFDFGGYATKNDLKCADGRTIRKDAFIDCDGMNVPLVWAHKHDDPARVLGHAILENREDGVYTYGSFNDTESGRNAKELVRHGDVRALSIYANQLVQKGGDVIHGMIREVSLCLAGANPGARIEELSFEHSIDEDCEDFEALLFNGENIVIEHAEEADSAKEEAVEHTEDTDSANEEVIEHAEKEKKEEAPVAEETKKESEKTVKDVFDSMNEEQKNVVYFMIGQALENEKSDEEEKEVSHNLFENNGGNEEYLAHAAMTDAIETVIKDGQRYGSLRKSYEHHMQEGGALAHAIDTTGLTVPDVTNAAYKVNPGYGINGLEYLFPEARELNDLPEFIKRDTTWVDVVLNGVKKTPFARVKTTFANITEDEARAKGYLKGKMKKEEFFSLMKRETTPTTIYKKQRFDRDDLIDLAKPQVVAWVKTEMRMMLNEELARAILIGDGRLASSDDKIFEDKIRPIVSDENFFTIKETVPLGGGTDEEIAKNLIKAAVRARKNYKGTGSPLFFTTESWLTEMLLAEDSIGRRLYETKASVAAAMRVRDVVPCELLENYTDANGRELIGIIVNPIDYNVGTDKGGEVNMFDDFDIDYNQFKYLIETRCSGALIKPYSAIALFKASGNNNPVITE